MTSRALLYSEMVVAEAVLRGDQERLLGYSYADHPVACQLGGSEPSRLAQASRIVENFGYDEVNLNIGCPSDRVQSGRFGACLMAEPDLVAACVNDMKAAVQIPVSVKCRIAIDDLDPEETLFGFTEKIVAAGVDSLTVHARKAWLKGLSPKENRSVPPLDYPLVYRLKACHPNLPISINGGIETLDQALEHLNHVDGVMMGRAAYHNPWLLADVDNRIFGAPNPVSTRDEVVSQMRSYMVEQCASGWRTNAITRHMIGLYAGERGARAFRRIMTTEAVKSGAGVEVIDKALEEIEKAKEPRLDDVA